MDDNRTRLLGNRNRRVAAACVVFVGSMLGAAYAAVPLYDLFCRVTGYGGTPQRVEAGAREIGTREITVRFDANTARNLPWNFRAPEPVRVRVGEQVTVNYTATNLSARGTDGTATFNVTPEQTGIYFSKIDCFCFTEQHLEPGESMEMGVTFFVDPAIVDNLESDSVNTITLSYTFFPQAAPVASANRARDDEQL